MHEPVVRFVFPKDPFLTGPQVPWNVDFVVAGGVFVAGTGKESLGCCADWFNCLHNFAAPASATVAVGGLSGVDFEWQWVCHSPGGGVIEVSDTRGWVLSWTPEVGGDTSTCYAC